MTHTPGHLVQAQACVAAILNEETMPMKDVLDCAGQCLEVIELAQQERTELLSELKRVVLYAQAMEKRLGVHERNATLTPAIQAIAKAEGKG